MQTRSVVNLRKRTLEESDLFLKNPKERRLSKSLCDVNHLKSEILVCIFQLLDPFTRIQLEMVCQRWRKIARDQSWKKTTQFIASNYLPSITRQSWKTDLDFEEDCINWMAKIGVKMFSSVVKTCQMYLKHVDLSGLSDYSNFGECWNIILSRIPLGQLDHLDITAISVNENQLQQIAHRFSTLRSVCLRNSLLGTPSLASFLTTCSLVEKLDLSENNLRDASFEHLENLPSPLRALNLRLCRGLTDHKLYQVYLHCRSLECLELDASKGDWLISSEALSCLLAELKDLRKLVILGPLAVYMTSLSNLKMLEHLEIRVQKFISDPFLQSISQCSLLKTISLHENMPDEFNCRYSEGGLRRLKNLRQLECLSLDNIQHLSDATLKMIIASNTALKKLSLVGCTLISDNSVMFLLENCELLEELNLAECTKVSNKTLKKLLKLKNDRRKSLLAKENEKVFKLYVRRTSISHKCIKECRKEWLHFYQ